MTQPCSTPTHPTISPDPLPSYTQHTLALYLPTIFPHPLIHPTLSHTPPHLLLPPTPSATIIQNEEDEFVERIRRQNRLKEKVELNILNYERNVPDIKKAQGSWLRAKREHALVAEKQVNILSLFNPCSSVYFPCCILSSKPL